MAERIWTREDAEALRAAVARFARAAGDHDAMPRPQATVLGHLDREGPLAITQLADRAQVRHQSMRETVEALQRAAALTAGRSDVDGRKVICTITATGRAALDHDREARTRWILDGAHERLTPKQRKTALKITAILDRIAAEPEPEPEPGSESEPD